MPAQNYSQLAEMIAEFKQTLENSPTNIIPNARRAIYLGLGDNASKFVNTDLTNVPELDEDRLLQEEFFILCKQIENANKLIKAITNLHTSLHNRSMINNPELRNVPSVVINDFEGAIYEACSSMIVLVDEIIHRRNIEGPPFIAYKENDSETLYAIIEATRKLCFAPQDWSSLYEFSKTIDPLPRQHSIWIPLINAAQILGGIALMVTAFVVPVVSIILPMLMFAGGLILVTRPYKPSGLTFFREANAAGNLKSLEAESERLLETLPQPEGYAGMGNDLNDLLMAAGP